MAKVLIIDDAWLSRQMIKKIIELDAHSFTEAENGLHGLEKISEQKPDCIILDLLMPKMNGFEFLQHLQENNFDIPVVVLSADIQESSRRKALELGASKMLNKPPNTLELRSAIEELTEI